MESIANETLHDILLKLPTRDVASCRCVCKPWRRLLAAPSFRRLHHARSDTGSGCALALLVSQARPRGKTMETVVSCVSSAKPMCRVVDLADEYRIASVCNGFIVLASSGQKEEEPSSPSACWDPVFVCNPVTGEKLQVPAPPGLKSDGRHLFAMGFSASTHQYKLFRLPFQELRTRDNHLDVYTLENPAGGWRRHPDPLRRHGVCWARSPPVLVDGKIYVLTKRNKSAQAPNNILVIDVASEAYRMYRLMPMPYQETSVNAATMSVFELCGQPCVAVHVVPKPEPDHPDYGDELHIWVMPTPQLDEKLPTCNWIRRYSFYCDRRPTEYSKDDVVEVEPAAPMGTWVEGQGILCCMIGDHLYRYDTTDDKDEEDNGGRFFAWDSKLRLLVPPNGLYERRAIYGGYRPTLLSPQDLADQQHDDDNVHEQFEQAWLHALPFHKPSNQLCLGDNGCSDQHVAKRRMTHS